MLTRRGLLLGAAALPLTGCSSGVGPDGCRTPRELVEFGSLAGAELRYEESGVAQTFRADPRLVELLEGWAAEWVDLSGLGPLTAVSTYGAYVDRCGSWHQAGRAFDFARLVHEGGEVSCRYDLWGDDAAAARGYWRLSASLAARFTYTLTYSFNDLHHNHIHVDNSVNSDGAPAFDPSSRAQLQVVQGVLRHVFGRDCRSDGEPDEATTEALRSVQRDLRITEKLSDDGGWSRFLLAAAAS